MSYIYEALLRAERERQGQAPAPESQIAMPAAEVQRAALAPEDQQAAPTPVDQQAAPASVPVAPPREEVSARPLGGYIAAESVPQFKWDPFIPSFPTLAKHGRALEQFRSLRSKIYQARNEAPLKTILVSSGMPTEGKSFVTANLAMSLARNSNNRILLIDGDLRRPALDQLLGAPNKTGLSDYLAGTADLNAIMQRCSSANSNGREGLPDLANLTFIPTGTLHENASELITNQRIHELISRVAPSFDWILIDSPPVLVFSDAVDLARAVDAVLLVVRGAQTTYEVAERTKTSFASSRVLGVVLNDIRNPPRRESYYDNYYYYYDKKDGAQAAVAKTEQETT
jgi:capsular exopolysaccharide synthesis family protein